MSIEDLLFIMHRYYRMQVSISSLENEYRFFSLFLGTFISTFFINLFSNLPSHLRLGRPHYQRGVEELPQLRNYLAYVKISKYACKFQRHRMFQLKNSICVLTKTTPEKIAFV
mmetsp:Transcript_3197/g.6623  ORF Transcript_3197/g.6623 Transcript_3197/m.6623 type:complete len:113 (-) Transcript_3197:1879-2217(-)